jgi:hypothetical protein
MNKNLTRPNNGRILALLGLAARKPSAAEGCPSDEALAAFIDHRLRGKDRKAVLTHLNRCSSCYHHWREVGAYLDSLGAADKAHQTSTHVNLGQRIVDWLSSWKPMVPVAAVAMLVALVVVWRPSSDLERQIDADYAAALARAPMALTQTARAFSLPWEEQALGFSEVSPSTPARAFGAGLWVGRAELLGTTPAPIPALVAAPGQAPWSETEWADYYELGRWLMLVWSVAQSGQRVEDWESYQSVLQELLAQLKQREPQEAEAQRAVAALSHLEPLLGALAQPSNIPTRDQLSRRLRIAIHQLAP